MIRSRRRFWGFTLLLFAFLSLMVACSSNAATGDDENASKQSDEEIWNNATKENPNNPWQYVEEKDARMKAKTWEGKVAEYTKRIEEYPAVSWYLAARGNAYRQLKKYTEAVADYNRAIEIDGDLAWYYAARGDAKYRMGQVNDALADYDIAIRMAPDEQRFKDAKAEIENNQ